VQPLRVLDEDGLAERTVAVTTHALAETRRAFDGVAADYDRTNTANPVLRAMRARVLAEIGLRAPRGSALLDLGCGPGGDAAALGTAGYRVTAIDWSPNMAEQARARLQDAGLDTVVTVRHLGIHELDRMPAGLFDAAYSNFGPLNCVPDLSAAARAIGRRLRPGGTLVASVIGRVCPWELALYLFKGDWSRARVRFATRPVGVPLNGRTVWTRYYGPGEFARAFSAAGFVRVRLRALGLFAPPPYLTGFASRHAHLVDALHRLDDIAGSWPGLRGWGDHFLIVLKKV
jgi:SAM-dependent methyltransferase